MNPVANLTELTLAQRRELLKMARARDLVRDRAELPPIEPADRAGRLPLSFAQQRLWFLEQLRDLGGAYHIRAGLRLRGALDEAALARALDDVVARHEALRTTFAQVDGVPEQRVGPADAGFALIRHDLAGRADADDALQALIAHEARAPFDLEHGPLVRGQLVRVAADEHVLLMSMHHIVSDAWSMGVFFNELSALYAAHRGGGDAPLPAPPVQYPDYAAWQRRWVEGDALQAQADYWTGALAGAPELLELPTDRPRPAKLDTAGASLRVELDAELTAGLKAVCRRQGTTLYMALLAAWAVVLGRLSGQDDVVIGSPVAGRERQELEGLIGFFVNTLALRVDLSGAPTVAELLGRVKARALAAQQNQDIPFEQVVELVAPARSLSHSPLFQVSFAWQNTPGGRLALPGLKVDTLATGGSQAQAKFDLSLALRETGDGIAGEVTYSTALFDRETVERYAGYLRRVLAEMAADDSRPVERLGLMSGDERVRVVETWNRTQAEYASDSCIHALFERQVERAPHADAVVFGDARWSYGELNARANRLAHQLRARGVGPEVRVAICLERGPEMVAAVLAVLKAGGAYVPLDPSYPADRLRYMLADSAPAVVLTQASAAEALGDVFAELGADVPVLRVDASTSPWASEADTNPARGGLTPEHAAYVIYTSGSTGRPKGVLVPHRGLCNVAAAQQRAFGVGAGDRVLQFASLSFDAAAFELVMALASGAALCVASRDELLPGPDLLALLRRHAVTTVTLPPSALAALPVEALPALRTITTAGEALSAELVGRWGTRHRLWNLYGPTEATIWSTASVCADPTRTPDIGPPIANTRAYVLDAAMEPLPVGVAGELYVGGAGVARGYLGRPALTAERFVPDPFGGEPGARLYRTGDRVRWKESAEVRECVSAGVDPALARTDAPVQVGTAVLDFVGRVDHQVKVRGFRIEPGEIEARLREHPGVREAIVLVREDAPGDARLVAYVVADETAGAEVLRAHLAERLPAYMVPAAFVRLDALPLTPNGKIDRRALPAPEGDAYAARGYEAPAGATEQALAEIWAEVLRVERVGRGDDFFALGGHSLLAVQVISRVRQVLGAEVALGVLFTHPVLKELARELETAARAELPPIEPTSRGDRLPLSFPQQRLWFLEQLGAVGSAYHIHAPLRLRGALDPDALARALDDVVARHEALRTTFAEVDGVPEQRIAPAQGSGFALTRHDLAGHADADAELDRLMAEESRAPFDLRHGPLIRGRLIRLADDDHVLLLTMHHIVSDGWSMGVLFGELSALYAAHREGRDARLAALPVQYADYAAWQRGWVEGDVLREQADYWTRTLAGAPGLLELPTDHPRPAQTDYAGALLVLELDAELTAGLKALGRRHGTTLFMTLLAGWAAVLGRLSGQDDMVIGTPTAGRGRREIEGLIGFFVNTLAVRVDLSDSPTVAELLGRVKERALGAQHHQDIPFEQVVELADPVRSLSHHPLFQVMFAWQEMARDGGLALPALQVGRVGLASLDVQAKFDLSLTLREAGDRIVGSITYAASLFERETVERWVGYLRRVLEEMVADDGRPVERLALLPPAERARVVEGWNRTRAYPSASCIHTRFERQVERAPDATAVVFQDAALTYAELNARANRLAHHLRGLGVGPDVRVALCVERGLEMMVAILAVLKAGGAYVPVDPAYPDDRLAFMLADSAPAAVLTQASLRDRVERAGVPVLALDGDAAAWADQPADNPAVAGLTPDHLAYVIYTSGSTGRPKGVLVPHRNVARLFSATDAWFGFGPDDVWTLFHSVAFDFSVWEMWGALLHGGRLVVVPGDTTRSPEAFYRLLCDEGVTVLNQTPSAFYQLMKAQASTEGDHRLRYVVFGGEALDVPLLRPWFQRNGDAAPRLVNMYGITETTVHVTWRPLSWADVERAGASPIGERIPDLRAYLLDAAGEPVPVGVPGELYVGGAGLARGYLGRPELTAQRFVADPFGGEPGARLYRTGDLGRWRPDGALEYLGRTDLQVKVRGFRIELGEIEARLLEHPGVREAVVLAREDAPGERRLVAYVVGDETAAADGLRAHLGERLPAYMVPAAYVRLDGWPLTSNGKLDRKALPAPEDDAYAARVYEAPVGHTEQALAEIWSEVLGIERVGRHDDFFELGGHSLLAVQVISRVRQLLAVEAELGQLFARPVLHDFARGVETAARAELPPIEPISRDERIPLSFAQQRLWFLEQLGNLGSTYHVPRRLRLRGALDRAALSRALDGVVARHEALRTVFAEVDGAPEQRIAPADVGFPLVEHDLAGRLDAEVERVMDEEARAPFDLRRGPLVRGRLIRLADDDHVLLLTMHHIVSDGWSIGVLFDELSALYAAHREGRDARLPSLPVQYADYAAWQRRWVEGDVLREQAEYWTRTLAGAPRVLELPTDRPRPAETDHAGAMLPLELDAELTAGLRALSRRHGTTLFMTLLAGWAAVLGRLSGQDDVVVGTPTAGRGRQEIEGLIGFFINTLAVRVELSGAPTVAELLNRVRERTLGAQHHQDIPFEQVVERVDPARSLSHTPLFQVMFAWQNAPRGAGISLPGLDVGGVGAATMEVAAKFDLSLTLREADDRVVGTLTYATSLFDRETVERWAGYLRRVLGEMAAGGDRPVERLALLSGDERARVLGEWNRTDAPYPARHCLHELFEAQVERTPDATALVFEETSLTYAELNERANRLAHHLRALGVGPDARVGLCVERSLEMMVGLLAVLKAGGAYVPLDPAYPAERLAYMLADSDPAVVLSQRDLRDRIGSTGAPVLDLDAPAPAWGDAPAMNPARGTLTAEHLAYVIYTSGSTGRPKGVGVPHRAVVNALHWMQALSGLGADDAVLHKTPYSFDASLRELLPPLLVGARLVLARPGGHRDPEYLLQVMRRERITTLHAVPMLLQALVDEGGLAACDALRTVMCGGEALPAALVRGFARQAPGARLFNVYGPTEAAVDVTAWPCTDRPDAAAITPIGSPMANVRVYLLDPAGEPVPVGVAGELHIGGVQVARGYLGRPDLTAERFVADPFGGTPGARLYRTGDLARWRADGTLDYLGRMDHQVKVRGFRIELGEIEAVLRRHGSVADCVVTAREDAPGQTRLVAYVVGSEAAGAEALRAHLGQALPEHMVPAAYVRLDALPLMPNGKLDRRALPAPEDDAFGARAYEAPVGETEQALAEIWAEVLHVDRVGRHDDFFELGGHSLLAVQVISRVRQVLAVDLPLRSLFESPSISQLSQQVLHTQLAQFDPAQIAYLAELVRASTGE